MSTASNSTKQLHIKQLYSTQTAPPKTYRWLLAVTILVLALVAAALLTYPTLALEWRGRGFMGAMITPSGVVDGARPVSSRFWPALENGLHRQDQILTLTSPALTIAPIEQMTPEMIGDALRNLQPRDEVTLVFLRPVTGEQATIYGQEICSPPENSFATCTVTAALRSYPDEDFLAGFVLPYASAIITLLIAIVLVYLRPNQPNALLIALQCGLLATLMAGVFDLNTTHRLVPAWIGASSLLAGLLATFSMNFPATAPFIRKQKWIRFTPLAVSILIGGYALITYFNPPNPRAVLQATQFPLYFLMLVLLMLTVSLLWFRSRTSSSIIRDQANILLIGVALSIAPGIVWFFNNIVQQLSGVDVAQFNIAATMPFFLLLPVSAAYAILQYRTLDTDRIISSGIAYQIMVIMLVFGYFLLVFGVTLAAGSIVRADNPFLVAVTIFVISALFLPVRTFLQRRIDKLYFRTRSSYEKQVQAFAQKLTTISELDQIIAEYRRQLVETVSITHSYIFLHYRPTNEYVAYGSPKPETDVRFNHNSGVVLYLKNTDLLVSLQQDQPWPPELRAEHARLTLLSAAVMVGLKGGSELHGFVLIGRSHSGNGLYDFEAMHFLQSLTGQMALAVERAQVVVSLERRVKELDVFSSVSQAVNFAIGFDDLLELVSNQTSKVVDSPNFYIALRDENTDEMYFAFFLEDGERYREKENRRWKQGRDLFSDITRTGQPLRVNDYSQALIQRDMQSRLENAGLRAWMGVPLIAGTRTLGVMAIGTPETNRTYNDDQLKIFWDIASLAATSIDKARLFAETNARARQLAVINEISQQLATELDVDKLLKLITTSAVEILNAEAGSLLLLSEDGSGDLEFKVAVGGSGQELVGRRLKTGQGLVGEVALRGKPVIVNDTSGDNRIAQLKPDVFHTSSVLAVPMLYQNKVTGVLEVLNKKDGNSYGPEDTSLLSTFAGQAAVALENARLFAMTDFQLNARLEELQTLERIDSELNRTLELGRVAEITLRWAVANTGATGGIIGIITDSDPKMLKIIAKYGYEAEDYPPDAEGELWPLDMGIIRRVMRTRQSDLASDITIDPDYVASLRDARSQLTVPMISGGEINAMLILESSKEQRLNLLDQAFVNRLAEHASTAIANAQLFEQLEAANRGKSEFVSFVAHELKTPMTSIKGYADLLLGGMVGPLTDGQAGFLGTIRSNVDRMNTLVSDLNDVTKLQTDSMRIELAPVDLRSVIRQTLIPLSRQIEEKKQTLEQRVPDNLPLIHADQNRLIQVLTNMISNAYKYTPEGGNIVIGAEVVPNQWDPKSKKTDLVMHIAVSDSGIGISEEDLAKLFTPYFRSTNQLALDQPGTGLGMTLTRGIIQKHGGQIWVESTLGTGSTFNFTLPLAPQTDAEPVRP